MRIIASTVHLYAWGFYGFSPLIVAIQSLQAGNHEGTVTTTITDIGQTKIDIPSIDQWLGTQQNPTFSNEFLRAFLHPSGTLALRPKHTDQCTNYLVGLQTKEMLVPRLFKPALSFPAYGKCDTSSHVYDFEDFYSNPEIKLNYDTAKNAMSIVCTFELKNRSSSRQITVARHTKMGTRKGLTSNKAQLRECLGLLDMFISIQNRLAKDARKVSVSLPTIDTKYSNEDDWEPPVRTDEGGKIIAILVVVGIVCFIILPILAWYFVWKRCFGKRTTPRRSVYVIRSSPPQPPQPPLHAQANVIK